MNAQWQAVGKWIKDHAGSGAALVGSLLTGNAPAAIAAGISLVSSATGTTEPAKALDTLQTDPQTVVKLRQLANENEADIREHIRAMAELEYKDAQAEQHETQTTVRAGDIAADRFVRWTRPGQSWVSLGFGLWYVYYQTTHAASVDVYALGALLTLSFTYAGLRQFGKFTDVRAAMNAAIAKAKP